MNRGASAAVQTEWGKSANEPAHLLAVNFDAGDGGPVYLTDSYRAVTWNGNTYASAGDLLGFSGLVETAELRVREVSVQLSGVNQTWISRVLAKQYLRRGLTIYQFFFNPASEALIVDPVSLHDGRMEEPRVDEDPASGKCAVTIVSRDPFSDFERRNGRHTNPNDQALWFPNDRAFDLFPQLAFLQRAFTWGIGSPTSNPGFGNLGQIRLPG